MSEAPINPPAAATEESTGWTVVAHLLRPQGRRGELLAELLTDFPERFAGEPRMYLAPEKYAGNTEDARAMTVTGHWLPVGRNAGRVVLAFAGIDSIAHAEPLAGLDVLIPSTERAALEDDAEYIADLIGCIVYDRGRAVGQVVSVDFAMTPDGARRLEDAAPLLTVKTSAGDEVLIPFVREFLQKTDTAASRIDMTLPEGLVELNRAAAHED